ncbi:MAG: hypothetical protein ABI577_17550 [bacterium]
MIIFWILGAVLWTGAIWLIASRVGVLTFGSRAPSAATKSTAEAAASEPEAAASGFLAYPVDYLFGVVDDSGEARAVTTELHSGGIADELVSTFAGEAGAIRIDAQGEHHGIFGRLARIAQAMSMDADHAQEYENAARAGKTVFAIHSSDADLRAGARSILKAHGGHFINYYARLHFETLDP